MALQSRTSSSSSRSSSGSSIGSLGSVGSAASIGSYSGVYSGGASGAEVYHRRTLHGRHHTPGCFSAIPSLAARDVAALTLQAHGFPPNLLPLDKVQSFVLKPDGTVDVRLSHITRKRVNGRSLKYSVRISGRIEKGRLSELKGICTKSYLLWLAVDTLQRLEACNLHMHVAAGAYSDIPVSAFA